MRREGNVSSRDGTTRLRIVDCRVVKVSCFSCPVALNLFLAALTFFIHTGPCSNLDLINLTLHGELMQTKYSGTSRKRPPKMSA